MPVVTERRRPASAAIVESAVQTVSKISQIAIPGVRETSKPEVTPKSKVEAKPTKGNSRECLNAAKIMPAGAMNGRNQSRKNAGAYSYPSHQVGLPIDLDEIATAIRAPTISSCVTTIAIVHWRVSDPAGVDSSFRDGGGNDIVNDNSLYSRCRR